jgi:hypothetical protein
MSKFFLYSEAILIEDNTVFNALALLVGKSSLKKYILSLIQLVKTISPNAPLQTVAHINHFGIFGQVQTIIS